MGVATIDLNMGASSQPDFDAVLTWQGGERFLCTSGPVSMTLDGKREEGPSPVQTLAFALGGCMSIDIVDVIEKGRLPIRGLRSDLRVFREESTPRRVTGIELRFVVEGDVPADRVERAIALSREKYCSVWHSLHPSISLATSFSVTP